MTAGNLRTFADLTSASGIFADNTAGEIIEQYHRDHAATFKEAALLSLPYLPIQPSGAGSPDVTLQMGAGIAVTATSVAVNSGTLGKRVDQAWAEGDAAGGVLYGSTMGANGLGVVHLLVKDDDPSRVDMGIDDNTAGTNVPAGWSSRTIGLVQTGSDGAIVSTVEAPLSLDSVAWVSFTGQGTNGLCTLIDRFNVESVERTGSGDYEITLIDDSFGTPLSFSGDAYPVFNGNQTIVDDDDTWHAKITSRTPGSRQIVTHWTLRSRNGGAASDDFAGDALFVALTFYRPIVLR